MTFHILNDVGCRYRLKLDLQLFAYGGHRIDPNGRYCIYLRKSRADLESEQRGAEDTFATHKRILFDLQRRLGITIAKIYQEAPATSGERISERPEMIRLLGDIEDEKWDGVLVVEVERLARGDTMDQGIVAQAFKYSNTLIITPQRTYDPQNPDDEEYFEFGLFMSRREFKTITRRLQTGRSIAIEKGRYVGNRPPYGYIRVKLPGPGYTLEPDPQQAPIVQLIFSLYTHSDPHKRMGTARIAYHLNEVLKVPTQKNSIWTVATVNGIIRNPTYIGRVRWKSRPLIKKKSGKSRPRRAREDSIEAEGLHQAIVSEDVYNLAQEVMARNGHARTPTGSITNPLAGLVKCAVCGYAMVGRPYKDQTHTGLICSKQRCKNVSSSLYIVEQKLLIALTDWIESYEDRWEKQAEANKDEVLIKTLELALDAQNKQLAKTKQQLSRLHDLLEQGVYSVEVFMERSKELNAKVQEVEDGIRSVTEEIEKEQAQVIAREEIIPKVRDVLANYNKTDDPAKKNELLRSVLESVTYQKNEGGRWNIAARENFTLVLFPKLPK